ncbi:MAG: hypothetical protein WBF42_07765, partial [Terracidiphilus sp.]
MPWTTIACVDVDMLLSPVISNPVGLLTRRRSISFWLSLSLILIYLGFCYLLFVAWVNPSLLGDSDQRIAADSGTYMHMGEVLREGRPEPLVYAALASFPNTLWVPVSIAYVLQSTWLIAAFNLLIFAMSVEMLRRASSMNAALFVGLL